jgi:hypothetical protein
MQKLKKRSIIDLKSHSQAMRLKNYGTLRLRAMLAIASFIIHDQTISVLHAGLPNFKSRTPAAHNTIATSRSSGATNSSG